MRSDNLLIGLVIFTLFAGLVRPHHATAQLASGGAGGGGGTAAYALADDERNLKFAGIPIPNYSEVLGASLGVVVMGYYKLDRHDDLCPPSSTGIFGFYSENNSWIGSVFQKVHYDQDKWRGTLALGTGSVKYQFNPSALNPGLPDIFLDYTTATDFGYLAGSRLTWRNLYLGLEALSWSARVSIEPDLAEVPNERYAGPGLSAEWDARDHVMYPTDGILVTTRGTLYDEAFGSVRNFRSLKAVASTYHTVGDTTRVLAARLLAETAVGDVPFSAQSIVSGTRNLRGYANGAHRGEQLVMLELEYRWNFHGRWGAVGFAGVAYVGDSNSPLSLDETLPGAGFGLRYRMIEEYRINARLDVAWGRDDNAVFFGIGEVF